MSSYLLIESRDPYSSGDLRGCAALARQLKLAGHEVALFLLQNGVLPVRDEARCPELRDAIGAHVEVLADEFSLRERGIDATHLVAGVRTAPISLVIERLAAGWKTIWH
jgi:sulfur relay (sulfurtransferase) complex TusBCD TusD component (DsrE family)